MQENAQAGLVMRMDDTVAPCIFRGDLISAIIIAWSRYLSCIWPEEMFDNLIRTRIWGPVQEKSWVGWGCVWYSCLHGLHTEQFIRQGVVVTQTTTFFILIQSLEPYTEQPLTIISKDSSVVVSMRVGSFILRYSIKFES